MRGFLMFVFTGVLLWLVGTVLLSDDRPLRADSEDTVPVEVEGIYLSSDSMSPIVVLRETEGPRSLPIWIGYSEAEAIRRRLNGEAVPRPMTHDLLGSAVRALGGEVNRIVVTNLENGTYFARVDLMASGDSLSLDARPSDAIALALGESAPIFVSRGVMDEAGDDDLMGGGTDRTFQLIGCGIWGQPLDDELRGALEVEGGILVSDLSPAQVEEGSLERGDVIVELGGQPAEGLERVRELLSGLDSGDPIPIRIMRGGQELEVELVCR